MSSRPALIVIASAKAKPGKAKELEKALRDVAEPTRLQHGSVSWALYRSSRDPMLYVAVERWASRPDHDKHLRGDHVKHLMAVLGTVLAEPPSIVEYEIVLEK